MITAQHVGTLGNTQVPTEWLARPGTYRFSGISSGDMGSSWVQKSRALQVTEDPKTRLQAEGKVRL